MKASVSGLLVSVVLTAMLPASVAMATTAPPSEPSSSPSFRYPVGGGELVLPVPGHGHGGLWPGHGEPSHDAAGSPSPSASPSDSESPDAEASLSAPPPSPTPSPTPSRQPQDVVVRPSVPPRQQPPSPQRWIPAHEVREDDLGEWDLYADEEDERAGEQLTFPQTGGELLPVLPLGAGLACLGLGLAFLGLRLRRR
ncbi:hypothetical protein [Streptomyces sparsus]